MAQEFLPKNILSSNPHNSVEKEACPNFMSKETETIVSKWLTHFSTRDQIYKGSVHFSFNDNDIPSDIPSWLQLLSDAISKLMNEEELPVIIQISYVQKCLENAQFGTIGHSFF